MNLKYDDICNHRLDQKEKALLASFATTANALSLIPGSENYNTDLEEHRNVLENGDKPSFSALKESLHQSSLLTLISDPSWNSISRNLEGAKECCGVDFERLIIALKSF